MIYPTDVTLPFDLPYDAIDCEDDDVYYDTDEDTGEASFTSADEFLDGYAEGVTAGRRFGRRALANEIARVMTSDLDDHQVTLRVQTLLLNELKE